MKNYIYKKKNGLLSLLISALSVYVYRNTLTDIGIGYAACAYLICITIWMLLGYGFSDVLMRMVRARLTKGQKSNALNILSASLVNQFVTGIVGAALCAIVTHNLMSGLLGLPKGRFLGCYLCVCFFFRMINEYLTGYASVSSGDKAVCIASVLRELFRIITGFLFMNMMHDQGIIASTLLMDDELRYIYAASGLFIGFCVTEILIFVFLFIVRLGLKLKSRGEYESYDTRDKAPAIFLNLWKKRIGNIIHGLAFCAFLIFVLSTVHDASVLGMAVCALMAPFAFSVILALYCGTQASVSWIGSVRKNEKGLARAYFDYGIHIVVISSVFCTAFFASVSKLVNRILLPEPGMSVSVELIVLLLASIFFSMALFSDQLCAMRDDRIPRIIADAAACLLGILSVKLCSNAGQGFSRTLMITVIVYSAASMICWCVITYVRLSMVFDPLRNILIPVVAGAVTAIFLLLITNAAAAHLGNFFTLLMCIPIGLIIYHSVLLLLRNYSDSELKLMPLGGVLYSLGQILKVM
ncbi:MAG: hypothetical protein K5871_02785 [Lachnospiraceae bacterium]|nr:hypothetical protein [Lachnospiraceae bacterium]